MTEAEQAASMPFDIGNPPNRILLAAHEVYRSKCVCPPREGALCYHCTWLENFHKELKALQATARQAARREVWEEARKLFRERKCEKDCDADGGESGCVSWCQRSYLDQEFLRRAQQEAGR